MARRLLLYTSYKYNRGPIITSSKYLYRSSKRRVSNGFNGYIALLPISLYAKLEGSFPSSFFLVKVFIGFY